MYNIIAGTSLAAKEGLILLLKLFSPSPVLSQTCTLVKAQICLMLKISVSNAAGSSFWLMQDARGSDAWDTL